MENKMLLTFMNVSYDNKVSERHDIYVPKDKILGFLLDKNKEAPMVRAIIDSNWLYERGLIDDLPRNMRNGEITPTHVKVKGELAALQGVLDGSKAAEVLYT